MVLDAAVLQFNIGTQLPFAATFLPAVHYCHCTTAITLYDHHHTMWRPPYYMITTTLYGHCTMASALPSVHCVATIALCGHHTV